MQTPHVDPPSHAPIIALRIALPPDIRAIDPIRPQGILHVLLVDTRDAPLNQTHAIIVPQSEEVDDGRVPVVAVGVQS